MFPTAEERFLHAIELLKQEGWNAEHWGGVENGIIIPPTGVTGPNNETYPEPAAMPDFVILNNLYDPLREAFGLAANASVYNLGFRMNSVLGGFQEVVNSLFVDSSRSFVMGTLGYGLLRSPDSIIPNEYAMPLLPGQMYNFPQYSNPVYAESG